MQYANPTLPVCTFTNAMFDIIARCDEAELLDLVTISGYEFHYFVDIIDADLALGIIGKLGYDNVAKPEWLPNSEHIPIVNPTVVERLFRRQGKSATVMDTIPLAYLISMYLKHVFNRQSAKRALSVRRKIWRTKETL